MLELSVYDGKFAQNAAESKEIGLRIEKDQEAGNCIHWLICSKGNGLILGTIGYYRGFKDSSGEIGYIIKKEFRGKGFCAEAIRCVCEFGFRSLELAIIRAYTSRDNVGSRRALEKNGFRVESQDGDRITYKRESDSLR
jgi:ribosomal-protein-alanine N-acetyltransferase